jgi:Fe2+ transport system protein FeoA
MKLSEVDIDEDVEITELLSDDEVRLRSLGISEGCIICPLRNNNSTMIVNVRGCRYAVSKELTDCILVKRL